jgi:cellobiose phosphorylase
MLSIRSKLSRLKNRLKRTLNPAGSFPAASPSPIYRYSADAREVWIETPDPPHPFINILYNESYFTILDHYARGRGRHMDPIQGYNNNVIENERFVYIRDDATGDYFSVGWEPCLRDPEHWVCRAGLNYQSIENTTNRLKVIWRIYVPAGKDPVEIWDVRVQDASGAPRRVSMFIYVGMKCDGVDLYCGELCRIAQYDPALEAIFVRMDAERHTTIDFPWHNGF